MRSTPHDPARAATPVLVISVLLAQIAFGLLAMTLILPSMAEWGRIFGADQAAVQLSFSAYVFAYGASQLVYGPLSDRLGRKPLLLLGLGLAVAGSLLAAFAGSLLTLTLARVVQGVGAAAGAALGRAMVQDLFEGPRRTQIMAYMGMVMGLCPPVAIVVGGQIHVHLGWQGNFVLLAALGLLLGLGVWRVLPERLPLPHGGEHWLRGMARAYARLGREPRFLAYVGITSASVGCFYAFLSGAPLVLREMGVAPDQLGWYMMAVPLFYIVGNFLTSHLVHRIGERRVMLLGQCVTLASLLLVLLLALTGLNSPWALTLPLTLLGIGHGLLMPASLSGTLGVVPALAGAAAAVGGLLQQLMGALAGYAVGWMPHNGAFDLGLLMLAFTLCAGAAQWRLRRLEHRPGR